MVYGTSGDDSLEGGAGIDHIFGFDGSDTITNSADDDVLDGGDGDDTVVFAGPLDQYNFVGNNDGTITVTAGWGDAGTDILVGIENVAFQAEWTTDTYSVADALLLTAPQMFNGTSGADYFTGGVHSDIIYGNAGNDWLGGGRGNDYIDGGDGDDNAVFDGYA